MSRELRFHKKPELSDLEGLTINGAVFKEGNGHLNKENIGMVIPKAFRFTTGLEVLETKDGRFYLLMTQYLTRGLDYWEMEDAFGRIGFRDPDIEEQMRTVCENLLDRGLAYWEKESAI